MKKSEYNSIVINASFYNLDEYLSNDVYKKFHKDQHLNAFDFFCIIIWKANRAKSTISNGLLKNHPGKTLDQICKKITSDIFKAEDEKAKFTRLVDKHGFRVPTASAILSVLYPEQFTVYDIRVCDILEDFHNIDNLKFENQWLKYKEFITAVKNLDPKVKNLREIDKVLWGTSFKIQLEKDIKSKFKKS